MDRLRAGKRVENRYIGQVYNGGAIPTSGPAMMLTHPIDQTFVEAESGAITETVDSTTSVPVLVYGSVLPIAGDKLFARRVGDLWIAPRSACGVITVTVKDASTGLVISGASVFFLGSTDIHTTNSSGIAVLSINSSGSSTITASKTGYALNTGTISATCGATNTLEIDLTPAIPCSPCAIPARSYALTITYWQDAGHTVSNTVTTTLTWDTGSSTAFVLGVSMPLYYNGGVGVINQDFFLNCLSGHIVLNHQFQGLGGGTTNLFYSPSVGVTDNAVICSPFSIHITGAFVLGSDETIDIS